MAVADSDMRRIPARELISPADLARLRQRSEWRGIALISRTITLSIIC
jgi:hypothetical protein